MILASCGDSFFYGTDLSDHVPGTLPAGYSRRTWPALIAQTLGYGYQCYAKPGIGNAQILKQIISAYHELGDDAIYFINWTWIDRFDYVAIDDQQWCTVRPSLDDSERDEFYYRYFHSELQDKYQSLIYIAQAQDILRDCRYIMTFMDYLILDSRWHVPDYIMFLQDRVRPRLENFDHKNFLEWSRERNYTISDNWHPLEQAHAAAAEYWLQRAKSL